MGSFCMTNQRPHRLTTQIEDLRKLLDEEEKELAYLIPKGK